LLKSGSISYAIEAAIMESPTHHGAAVETVDAMVRLLNAVQNVQNSNHKVEEIPKCIQYMEDAMEDAWKYMDPTIFRPSVHEILHLAEK
jgi:hypothetical protein